MVVYCPECEDLLEAEYVKGRWYCENCGTDVTALVEAKMRSNLKKKNK